MSERRVEGLAQTIEDAKSELQDFIIDGNTYDDAQDYIHELADSATPIHTGDILQYALEDYSLATTEPEIGPAFDGSPTAVNIIAANIYEAITQALSEYLEELWEQKKESIEEEEDE